MFNSVIKEEFGSIGFGKFQPDFYKNKTIFIKSTSSVWANELFLNKRKIIRKINNKLGRENIKYIKIN